MQQKSIEAIEIFGESFAFLKNKLKDFGTLALTYVASYLVLALPILWLSNAVDAKDGLIASSTAWTLSALLVMLLLGALFFVIMIWLSAANLFLACERAKTWQQALKFSWQRLWPMAWLSLQTGFLVVLGFVALIFPGFAVITFLSVAGPVLVREDLSAWKSIKQSFNYVQGRGWKVFWVIFFGLALALLLNFIISIMLLPFNLSKELGEQVANGISGIFTTPVWSLVSYQLYLRLKK